MGSAGIPGYLLRVKSGDHKMTTPQEKAQRASWFIDTKSDVQTQRNYTSKYGRDPVPC